MFLYYRVSFLSVNWWSIWKTFDHEKINHFKFNSWILFMLVCIILYTNYFNVEVLWLIILFKSKRSFNSHLRYTRKSNAFSMGFICSTNALLHLIKFSENEYILKVFIWNPNIVLFFFTKYCFEKNI